MFQKQIDVFFTPVNSLNTGRITNYEYMLQKGRKQRILKFFLRSFPMRLIVFTGSQQLLKKNWQQWKVLKPILYHSSNDIKALDFNKLLRRDEEDYKTMKNA